MNKLAIPVIDLFAGPGGLGEGFSTLRRNRRSKRSPFTIVASVEKEESASKTLLARSYFRQLVENGLPLKNYYAWLNHGEGLPQPQTPKETEAMKAAKAHAILHELGADQKKDKDLEKHLLKQVQGYQMADHSVLIGGPPCQAYSLVGRARNLGTKGYSASKDHRHFLYREYLRILDLVKPAVFVMENVAGILSSKVDGHRVFPDILKDLAAPYKAMDKKRGKKYRIHSLVTDEVYCEGDDPNLVDGKNFRIKSEEYGIPQKRHRVILLGVREDLDIIPDKLEKAPKMTTVEDVISDLPQLRSKLSKVPDSDTAWTESVEKAKTVLQKLLTTSKQHAGLDDVLKRRFPANWNAGLSLGTSRLHPTKKPKRSLPESLQTWYLNGNLKAILNHEARGHIYGDLERYLFSSCYAQINHTSPKARDFPKKLSPKHKNWRSGKFADRFRTQVANAPSTTVTSHISKDGNYFIHPDPAQCRSLTVREAARLQTFPDDYIFLGNRTEQYVQVGNAVPPLLARQIAEIVFKIIYSSYKNKF